MVFCWRVVVTSTQYSRFAVEKVMMELIAVVWYGMAGKCEMIIGHFRRLSMSSV